MAVRLSQVQFHPVVRGAAGKRSDNGSFGERLRRLRRDRRLTQVQLADKLGTDASYVARLETGRIGNPGLESMRRLAEVLGISLHELTGDSPTEGMDVETAIRSHSELDDEAKTALIRMFRALKRPDSKR